MTYDHLAFMVVLGSKLGSSGLLSECITTEPSPQLYSFFSFIFMYMWIFVLFLRQSPVAQSDLELTTYKQR